MSQTLQTAAKARLVAAGTVSVEPSLIQENAPSTAGPGAGLKSIFFRFGPHRVRLLVDAASSLRLVTDGDGAAIVEGGEVIVRGKVEPVAVHCPRQAYVNISESCVYDCAFCPVPSHPPRIKSVDDVVAMVERSLGNIDAVSITSGVAKSPKKDLPHILDVVRALHRYRLPIGVSIYPCDGCSDRLRGAGAVEVKYNLEVASPGLFRKFCPGLDRDYIWASLLDAVKVFGRNRVYSNIIIGLGESDADVNREVRRLTRAGVVPILRPFQPHPALNCPDARRPPAERLVALAERARTYLEDNGLNMQRSLTMCGRCTGCDLAPQVDL